MIGRKSEKKLKSRKKAEKKQNKLNFEIMVSYGGYEMVAQIRLDFIGLKTDFIPSYNKNVNKIQISIGKKTNKIPNGFLHFLKTVFILFIFFSTSKFEFYSI
jgi:hypothetical protein